MYELAVMHMVNEIRSEDKTNRSFILIFLLIIENNVQADAFSLILLKVS